MSSDLKIQFIKFDVLHINSSIGAITFIVELIKRLWMDNYWRNLDACSY